MNPNRVAVEDDWPNTENTYPVERETVLEEATRHVDGARQSSYGTPLTNHTATAEMFEVWRRRRVSAGHVEVDEFDAIDTCVFNICQKLSRMANDIYHRDNLVDIAGYIRNLEMVLADM